MIAQVLPITEAGDRSARSLDLWPAATKLARIEQIGLDSELSALSLRLADADEAVRQHPESTAAFVNRGRLLARMNRNDEALADLEEAWRMNPLGLSVISARADVLDKLGRGSEASAQFDAIVAIDPSETALNARCWRRAIRNIELGKAESDCAAAIRVSLAEVIDWIQLELGP